MRANGAGTVPKRGIQIGSLHLSIQNAAGHEHRVGPIAGRAASIFASRLENYFQKNGAATQPRSIDIASLTPSLQLNLRLMGDEQAAEEVASAWFEAVQLQLKLGN